MMEGVHHFSAPRHFSTGTIVRCVYMTKQQYGPSLEYWKYAQVVGHEEEDSMTFPLLMEINCVSWEEALANPLWPFRENDDGDAIFRPLKWASQLGVWVGWNYKKDAMWKLCDVK